DVDARLAKVDRLQLRVAVGDVQQARIAAARDVVERIALTRERALRGERKPGSRGGSQSLEEFPAVHCSSISSAIAAMPAAAHAWSASPPGAPDTPIPPRVDPPASIIMPPPIATNRGTLRSPDIDSPGRVRRSRSRVCVRKEI